jgi:uncharacterized protein
MRASAKGLAMSTSLMDGAGGSEPMGKLLLTMMIAVLLGTGVAWAGAYEEGHEAVLRHDWAEALKWFKMGAAQGDVHAEHDLAVMYARGDEGVGKNYPEALRLYRLSAAGDNAWSQFALGYMYERGEGVEQDYAEAAKWYRLEAAHTEASSLTSTVRDVLGKMYEEGRGVPQDYERAHMWFNLAALSGEYGIVDRDRIAQKMTPQQIAEAQKLARECQQRNFKGCD